MRMNAFHRHWLDIFLNYYTDAGDGFFTIMLALFFYFIKKEHKLGLLIIMAYAFTGIVVQVIKHLVDSPRPLAYFSPKWLPFFIDGVIHIGRNSFPSGHSTTAFAVACILAMHYHQKKWVQWLLLLMAVLAAYSRVYLSQHFMADIMAGSVIGIAGALLCAYWCRNMNEEKLVFRKRKNV